MAEESTGSDLEQRLSADETGAARDDAQRRLEQEAAALKRKMDSGASPTEFADLQKQYEGVQAAAEMIAFLWKHHHGG